MDRSTEVTLRSAVIISCMVFVPLWAIIGTSWTSTFTAAPRVVETPPSRAQATIPQPETRNEPVATHNAHNHTPGSHAHSGHSQPGHSQPGHLPGSHLRETQLATMTPIAAAHVSTGGLPPLEAAYPSDPGQMTPQAMTAATHGARLNTVATVNRVSTGEPLPMMSAQTVNSFGAGQRALGNNVPVVSTAYRNEPPAAGSSLPSSDRLGRRDELPRVTMNETVRPVELASSTRNLPGGKLVTPVGHQTELHKSTRVPVTMQANPTPRTSAPADWFEWTETRLKQLGASQFILESASEAGEYRFRCKAPLATDAGFVRHFEARGDSALAAMQTVLQQIESWRASIR